MAEGSVSRVMDEGGFWPFPVTAGTRVRVGCPSFVATAHGGGGCCNCCGQLKAFLGGDNYDEDSQTKKSKAPGNVSSLRESWVGSPVPSAFWEM